MRYKNNNTGNNVVYKDSPTKGFTCVDLEATPEEYIYSVDYKLLTEGFNYILYTTRCNRPAFVTVGEFNHLLHVNEVGGWHYDPLPFGAEQGQ